MEAKLKIEEMKDRLLRSIGTWADSRIDEFAESHPRLKIASVYMKRGVKNYLAREEQKLQGWIDDLALFLLDENGCIDVDMVFDDLLQMFESSDEIPFGSGLLQGTIGHGVIRFQLPDNPVSSLIFGSCGAIKITADDLRELKTMLTEEAA